jgi:ABC-type antimicrobial peptide transport system permease subunit
MYRSWRNSPENLPEPREFTIIGVFEANNGQGYSRLSNNQLLAPVSVNNPINMASQSEVVKKDGDTVIVKSIPGSSSQKFYSVFLKIKEGQYNTTKSALEAMIQDEYGQKYMVYLKESFSSLESMKTSIRYISMVMLGFGFLILIIGSIGILSTMMVNILERTRQIGIEKALGASRRYIFFKFSIESIMISLGGGILGLILAYFLSGYITDFFANMPVSFPRGLHVNAVYLSLIVAIFVGWLFGMYPAQQAAKLNVTEALREK